MIKENQVEKQRRIEIKEAEKAHAQQLIADAVKHAEEQDQRRADEWAAREQRIQKAMERMADTVVKRGNQAEREMERRLLRAQ